MSRAKITRFLADAKVYRGLGHLGEDGLPNERWKTHRDFRSLRKRGLAGEEVDFLVTYTFFRGRKYSLIQSRRYVLIPLIRELLKVSRDLPLDETLLTRLEDPRLPFSMADAVKLARTSLEFPPEPPLASYGSLTILDLSKTDLTEMPSLEGVALEELYLQDNFLREFKAPDCSRMRLIDVRRNYLDLSDLDEEARDVLRRFGWGYGYQRTPTKIEEGLFLGSIDSTRDLEELSRLGITQVLSLCKGAPKHPTLKYLTIPLQDNSRSRVPREKTHPFISQGSTLVHCIAGVSRSAAVVIDYLLERDSTLSYEEVFRRIFEKRPVICPKFR